MGALYLAGFSLAKARFLDSSTPEISRPLELDHGFRSVDYPLEYRPFTLVAIGRNNGAFVDKTLRSMFSQVYPNYRIIYVDDGSTDGSFSLVKDLVDLNEFREKLDMESYGDIGDYPFMNSGMWPITMNNIEAFFAKQKATLANTNQQSGVQE